MPFKKMTSLAPDFIWITLASYYNDVSTLNLNATFEYCIVVRKLGPKQESKW